MSWQPWTVEWDEGAAGDLVRRDPRQAAGIAGTVAGYATLGHGDVSKLAGHAPRWRPRAARWRVLFTRSPATRTLVALAVTQREDAYR